MERPEILTELLALNITYVAAEVSGSGDSGWVDTINYKSGLLEAAAPSQALNTACETFLFNCLDAIIPGFVNDEGGYGQLEWDTFNDQVQITGGTYYTETDEFEPVTI